MTIMGIFNSLSLDFIPALGEEFMTGIAKLFKNDRGGPSPIWIYLLLLFEYIDMMPNCILNIYVCLHISGGTLLIRETSIYNGEWLMQRNLTGKNAENKALLSILYYMGHGLYFHQSSGYITEEGIKRKYQTQDPGMEKNDIKHFLDITLLLYTRVCSFKGYLHKTCTRLGLISISLCLR